MKRKFVELAGGCCQKCGFNEFIAALEFHHVYPQLKKYNPVRVLYGNGLKKAWNELDKCCLLCATCHAAYTAGEWRAEFIKRDGLGWTVGDSLPLDDDRYDKKPEIIIQSPLPMNLIQLQNKQLRLL